MKRYNVNYGEDSHGPYVLEEESFCGRYVDADIAEELYDALKTAMRYFDQVIIETGYQSEGEAIAHNKCKQALSNADKD